MERGVQEIRETFNQELQAAHTSGDVEALQVKYLGKKGPLQQLMKDLKEVDAAQRPLVGKQINDLKVELSQRCEEALFQLGQKEQSARLANEVVDVTLPGRSHWQGRKHIITQVLDQLLNIFVEMGFSIQEGPEVETEYYNFEALNFPPDHPARDMQDTFFISDEYLLRTHTSNIQARVMEATRPPIRVVAPGRVYRNEVITARSHVFFHQIEGFYVDKNVSFSNLFATIDELLTRFLGKEVKTRFRPSYFPFVEPGLEIDISCLLCGGKGCGMCKQTGWVEVMGAGMIHPEVLRNGGIDPEEYSGFAWGLGVERFVNLKYGVRDIRLFTENDVRFLQQFPGV